MNLCKIFDWQVTAVHLIILDSIRVVVAGLVTVVRLRKEHNVTTTLDSVYVGRVSQEETVKTHNNNFLFNSL
jgi:hypothetical protein